MKIIDGKKAVLGRIASFAAKEALKGEEIVIVNCNHVIITGNRRRIQDDFEKTRKRVGSGQTGPKVSRKKENIVKRAVRRMLPNYRMGRGRQAYKRIKCYLEVPKEFEKSEKISVHNEKKRKFIKLGDLRK
jgi:large subunit ribosomal protein L13